MSHCHDCSTAVIYCELLLLKIILSVFSHNTLITVHNIVSSVETTGDVPSSVHTVTAEHYQHHNTMSTSSAAAHLCCSSLHHVLAAEVITHHHFASPSL